MKRSGGKNLSLEQSCFTDADLHAWVRQHLGVSIPLTAVCRGHDAPFEYLRAAYREPAKDLVVWAPRGGGKTYLGAIATLLDLLHKPPCQVRIIGGSIDQSLKMWEHLWPMLEDLAPDQISGRSRSRRIEMENGSIAAVLSQSQRAVRGLRVQKLRCDEVEMFDEDVWEAAQLVTRSRRADAASGAPHAAGVIEAISTWHEPFGLMGRIIADARRKEKRIIHWCLIDVLGPCEPDRPCDGCPLFPECKGSAKRNADGFISIEDALSMMTRVSRETWESEMLCRKPSARRSVFPHYDERIHVVEQVAGRSGTPELALSMDFGFAAPFVCLWIRRWPDGTVHVFDEYVQPGRRLLEHLDHIRRRPWGDVTIVTCDMAGSARNDQTGKSNVNLLREEGYSVRCGPSIIVDGLEMLRAALAPASGPPTLFIHPRCAALRKAMQGYHYAPGGSELPIKDGEHDHLIDALRYHFVNWNRSAKAEQKRY